MLFETEEEHRDFKTIQRTDYCEKKIPQNFVAKPIFGSWDEKNAIKDPYKNLLNTKTKNESLHPKLRSESVEDFLKRSFS